MITKFTPTQDLHKYLYFETNRLVVRQYILNDIQELFKIMCDVRVHTYTKDKDNPWDKGRTEEYIQFMIDKDFKTLLFSRRCNREILKSIDRIMRFKSL